LKKGFGGHVAFKATAHQVLRFHNSAQTLPVPS
jgi:hypothetical protein